MFSLEDYLDQIDIRLLDIPEGRRELTRLDPLAFALIYMPHHLKGEETDDQITFSEFHLGLIEYAKEWIRPLRNQAEFRDAFVAPRACGKSTWLFLILPLWAAAHGHVKFIAAFADATSQAQQHLSTFKRELDNNELLRADFSQLCTPKKRSNRAVQISDNKGEIQQENGFIFMARGADSAALGMKVGNLRPQLLILDDIEPGESNYSPHNKQKRLKTLQDDIFPLNSFARVVISGTTTMPGSIIHDLVTSLDVKPNSEEAKNIEWVFTEKIKVHYYPAIVDNGDGTERSVWPEKWPLEELQAIRHTRQFMKNMMNKPVRLDGSFWGPEDYIYDELEYYGKTIISIDPAVTNTQVSDFTGISVISQNAEDTTQVYVRYSNHVKMAPGALREHVIGLLERFPETQGILIETNQGGDTWLSIFHTMPVPVKTIHQKAPKAVRAEWALAFYQRKKVMHTEKFTVLEEEQMGFPNVAHDDTLDSAATGILFFLKPGKKKGTQKTLSYL